jgi:hypothetical protein
MATKKRSKIVSLSGEPVEHHREGPRSFLPPPAELGTETIVRHIERHLGPIESVFHELLSDAVHLDVHWVKPTPARPFHLLVTSGMSDRPMKVPPKLDAPRRIELVATLPERWDIGSDAFQNENWYWPLRLLKTLARFPHKYDTWIGEGHTVTNDDPPQPFAPGTRLCGTILLAPQHAPEAFRDLRLPDGRMIRFLAVVPVHDAEMTLKTRSGTEALLERLRKAGVTDVIEPARPSVAR